MADSLDNFFAKKDKKRKNKSQAAALSAEALVRELGEGSKHSEYSSKRKGKSSAALELLGLDANDNDWKDFEEVEKRDYTGLKVKEMSIQDQEEEQRRLAEPIEQVPESLAWKSKEETVAAIISAKEDPYTSELLRDATAKADDQNAKDKDKDKEKDKDTDNDKEKDKDKDTGEAASEKTSPQDSASEQAPPKKEAEGSKASAKYIPPHERMEKDVKVLEPVRLSRLVGPRSHAGKHFDIQDDKAFPSLG